ncbi:MAG: helix-turn-helix transcriptional regulator [Erysipelotrichaceae bacterium]|nr:helix-turn-helix transcriptional regulator [Erysipelotrichaceae bacterium]
MSRQAVSKWETGQSQPTAQNLADLAMLFDISISELVIH